MNRPTVVNPTDIRKSSRISLHPDTCQAFVDKKEVNLTITEFNLLACFLKSGGKTLSRDDLLSTVWGQSYRGTERTVDTHINRLRGKLGKAEYFIKTVRGVGYRLENSD
jgi:DNA-binding response OmpR family regulator